MKLKDVNVMSLEEQRINSIASKFQSGESTKQEAFDDLIQYSVEVLTPFTEERKVGLKLVSGALEKLRKLMEGTILDTLKLGSTYCAPARQLAKAHIEGTTTALQFVLDNFKANGDTANGDLPGPLFAPTRLQVSMKSLRAKDKESKFEVSDDDILMVRDRDGNLHRYGSLSVSRLIDILRDGKTEPETLDLIVTLIGKHVPEEEKAQPGILGRNIEKIRKAANAGEKPDTFALDLCESLELAIDEARDACVRRIREERAQAEAKADMERRRKRLERQQTLGAEREGLPASTVDKTGAKVGKAPKGTAASK